MKPATIHDVAESAGVSITTVSRVLNNDPKVKPATRDLVLAVATALNYRPSIAARSNGGARSFWICILHQNPGVHYIHSLQQGAMQACVSAGRLLSTHALQSTGLQLIEEVQGIIDALRPSGILLVSPLSASATLCEAIRERGVAFVRLANESPDEPSPSVSFNEREAARRMTESLIELGHRRITFIRGMPPDAPHADPRYEGYMEAMAAAGLALPKQEPPSAHFSFDQALPVARRLLTQAATRRPTAIQTANDDMGVAVLRAAHELGLNVPDDLSVAGYDGSYISEVSTPMLATVHTPLREMAARAVELLVAGGAGPQAPQHLMLPYRLGRGSSIAAPPPRNRQQPSS